MPRPLIATQPFCDACMSKLCCVAVPGSTSMSRRTGSKPKRSTKIVCLPGFRWPVNGVRPMAPISLRSMKTSAPGTFDVISTQPR